MNKQRVKQILILVAGFLVCRLPFAGCYPFVPAYFAAAFLEEVPRTALAIAMFAGMAVFLPITQVAKYGMAVLVILVVVKLTEWVEKGCYSWFTALAAGISTAALSVSGRLLFLKDSLSYTVGILEGLLIFGLTMIFSRLLHGLMGFELPKKVKLPEESSTDERLLKYADSFQGLSKVFSGMERQESISGEEIKKITSEVTERYCTDCQACAVCWNQTSGPMQQYFYDLPQEIMKMGKADRDMELKMEECCPYAGSVIEEAEKVFEKARLNVAWYNRLIENRIVIAEQLDAMAYIMENLAAGEADSTRKRKRLLTDLKYRARERGIVISDASVMKRQDGHERICLEVSLKTDNCIPVKELTQALNAVTRVVMVPQKDARTIIGREKHLITYEEETKYHSVFGVSKRTKNGGMVSGDNFSALETGNGEVVYSLSDGMGFGSCACKESELVLELIEKFLEAGFDKETAIRMMNSAMVIHGQDERYSTIDISSIDLYSGECSFYKIGAAATFIKRNDEVLVLESTTLPVGSFQGLEIEKRQQMLEAGDFVIMVTDGMLEDLHVPDPTATMQNIIETIQVKHPGKMADKIMERILLFTGGYVRDDMTVLVTALWEN